MSTESAGVARADRESPATRRRTVNQTQMWTWTWSVASTIMPEERLTSLIPSGWRVFIQKTSLSVRRMAGRHIVQPAASLRLIERIIVGKLIDVRARWIISVLGRLLWLSRGRSVNVLTAHRVGGVVSETSFKFFIQFVVYTAMYCGYILIVSAYYTAEIRRNVSTY